MRALTEDVRALVRSEVRAVRGEVVHQLSTARRASVLLGGAGVFGLLAIGSSAALLLRLLDTVLPRTASAAIVTALYGGAAGALAAAGIAEARRVSEEVGRAAGQVREGMSTAQE
jgi:hypothetical protein